MPNLKIHCAISKKRTGFNFRELHEWIDNPTKKFKGKSYDHRLEKHAYNESDEKKIKEFWNKKKGRDWGDKAVVEWLFHIAIDNLSTAFKKSLKVYGRNTYNVMEFGFKKSNYIFCEFDSLSDKELEEYINLDFEEED